MSKNPGRVREMIPVQLPRPRKRESSAFVNVSWGLIFPLAWTGMFFIKSGGLKDVLSLVPGVVSLSILFGTTSLLSVSEVFEAQTFSNFFRFPMIFLCGLFFPVEQLPVFLRPLSYIFPLTYGVDILHGAFHGHHIMPFLTDFTALSLFCVGLFLISLYNIGRRWIL